MSNDHNRLYNDLSHLWPIISPPHEYAIEAWYIREAITGSLGPGRHTLLDLGSGGGHVLSHLTETFSAIAVDISASMTSLSERLNPGTPHHVGDMRDIRLNQRFDAVLIHDAINYMLSENDLKLAFETALEHLHPHGVLVLAPDWFKEDFSAPTVLNWTKPSPNGEITFIEYLDDPDTNDTTIESVFFYIVKESGTLQIHQDRHTTGLFPKCTWLSNLRELGFLATIVNFPSYEGGFGGNLIVATFPEN